MLFVHHVLRSTRVFAFFAPLETQIFARLTSVYPKFVMARHILRYCGQISVKCWPSLKNLVEWCYLMTSCIVYQFSYMVLTIYSLCSFIQCFDIFSYSIFVFQHNPHLQPWISSLCLPGKVYAWSIDPDTGKLAQIGVADAGGTSTCYLFLDHDVRISTMAWTSGSSP